MFRPNTGLDHPLAEFAFARGNESHEGGGAGLLGISDTVHKGSAAQAGATLSPTALHAMFLVGANALWHREIRQEPSWAVAKSLDSGASLSGFKPPGLLFSSSKPSQM